MNTQPDSSLAKRRILVVDDNGMNREMLTDFLDLLGYEADSADSGASGLERIRSHPPDTILLDIDMPGMSGLEMLGTLFEDENLRHTPVIMISGRDDLENIVASIELGAADFLAKPFNPTILQARLRACLEKKDFRDRERELLESLEKSYADLREAESSRDSLTHMIVHDLGNPLAVIKMNAELLRMQSSMGLATDADALKERLQHIDTASASMERMIRGMLDVSALESGQMTSTRELVDVGAMIGELAAGQQASAREHSIKIVAEVDTGGLTLTTDRALLERVVGNLITNAFKYATSADKLLLAARAEKDGLLIVVEDNGVGIPQDLHTRVFDKYFQVADGAASRSGVGLGLAFCQMATRVLGGQIWVESGEKGGARFVIRLTENAAGTAVDPELASPQNKG